MIIKKKNIFSLWIFILLSITIIIFRFSKQPENVLSWDVFGYYLYLPATFIYDDLSLQNSDTILKIIDDYNISNTFYQANKLENGNWVIKYSMGLSIFYSPFFFTAHIIAQNTDYVANGFSLPYQNSIAYGLLIYTILGIWFLRKILLRFFSDKLASLIMISIILGTNYFNLTTFNNLMSHNMLFFTYTIILWLTIRWHETFKIKHAILLGVFIGLAILSRPVELVCILIPVFWNVYDKESFVEKRKLFLKYRNHVLGLVISIILIGIPQLIYWKITSGKFFFYSYQNPGEGFEFLWPYTLKFLFSFRKGWLIYTPIMIFAILGFYYLYKNNRKIFFALFIYFIINLWVVSSWSCWHYAASFSSRAIMQSYAIMAIPLGYFFMSILGKNNFKKYLILILTIFFIILNLFQIWQYNNNIIDPYRMTGAYYFKTFGKTKVSENERKYLSFDRFQEINENTINNINYKKTIVKKLDFDVLDQDNKSNYSDEYSKSEEFSFILNKDKIYSPSINYDYKDLSKKDYVIIKTSVYVFPIFDLSENPVSLVVTFLHKGKNYKYQTIDLEEHKHNIKLNQWNKVTMYYLSPEVRQKSDNLLVYVWLRGQQKVFVDDLLIEVFEPRN